MVDRANLPKINILYKERSDISTALKLENPRIFSFTLGQKNEDPEFWMRTVTIPAGSMPYPPQMIASIKQLMEERLAAITEELIELGVTGMDEPDEPEPEPEPVAAPKHKPKRRAA